MTGLFDCQRTESAASYRRLSQANIKQNERRQEEEEYEKQH